MSLGTVSHNANSGRCSVAATYVMLRLAADMQPATSPLSKSASASSNCFRYRLNATHGSDIFAFIVCRFVGILVLGQQECKEEQTQRRRHQSLGAKRCIWDNNQLVCYARMQKIFTPFHFTPAYHSTRFLQISFWVSVASAVSSNRIKNCAVNNLSRKTRSSAYT